MAKGGRKYSGCEILASPRGEGERRGREEGDMGARTCMQTRREERWELISQRRRGFRGEFINLRGNYVRSPSAQTLAGPI